MEARFGGTDGDFENGGGFFERKTVLIVEEEDGAAGGRDLVEERQEDLVRRLAEGRVEGGQTFRRRVFEGMPAAGALEMAEGKA